MRYRLGNLEEMILLTLMLISDEAYGVSIRDEYVKQSKHNISLSAVHTVLRRLEKKGFIESDLGGATTDRGGRRKRLYKITRYGYSAVAAIQEERTRIWNMIPNIELFS